MTLLVACASLPTTTPQTTPQVTTQSPSLAAFVNGKYSYKFFYPATAYVYPNNDPFVDSLVKAPSISVFQAKDGNFFNVNIYQNTEKDLKQYVEKMWNIQKDDRDENDKPRNKNLSSIEKTNINNKEAYKFTLGNSYADGMKGGYVLDKENTYVFTENNWLIYEIHFPSENENSKNLLNSFEFFDSKTAPQTNQQANISNCKNNYKNEQDQCLLTYAKNQVFHLGSSDSSTCKEIAANTAEQNECYWLFAMKSKNSALCSAMPTIPNETYLTKENCEKEISYKNGNNEWKLRGGYPPYYNEDEILYFGKAELTGWLEQKPADPYAYFNLTTESKTNLPPYMQKFSKFRIEYYSQSQQYSKSIPEEVLSKLRGSSESNPIKISTKQLSQTPRLQDKEQNDIPALFLSYL